MREPAESRASESSESKNWKAKAGAPGYVSFSMKPKLLSSVGSQHARRVRMLIHEMDLDVDVEEVPFGAQGFGGDAREAFIALNPNGKVPVLQHGDLVLWESNAIMWYLAESHGDHPLWPAAPRPRAEIAMWQVWQAAHLTPAADGLFFENCVKPTYMKQESDAAAAKSHRESFHRWMNVMAQRLQRADYLALDRFTCADIAVGSALMHAESSLMPVSDYPAVVAWLGRVRARPSWVATEPPPMPT